MTRTDLVRRAGSGSFWGKAMMISRRDVTIGSLAAIVTAAAGRMAVATEGSMTVAVLFDGLYSEFWVPGSRSFATT